jgi:hypothetical protein
MYLSAESKKTADGQNLSYIYQYKVGIPKCIYQQETKILFGIFRRKVKKYIERLSAESQNSMKHLSLESRNSLMHFWEVSPDFLMHRRIYQRIDKKCDTFISGKVEISSQFSAKSLIFSFSFPIIQHSFLLECALSLQPISIDLPLRTYCTSPQGINCQCEFPCQHSCGNN